jgi:D-beta-D-heptose 7-phosphate kinase/D-beta-D-heptose 1-phosphate adenosyltransferase
MSDISLVDRLKGASVAVIGDVMLDNHVFGHVSRVSEEAPVPILHVQDERQALGGAANVAANIASLGGRPRLIGLLGEDQAAARFMSLLGEARIEPRLLSDRARPTTVKTRYLGARQQMVRVDRERIAPPPERLEAELIEEIEEAAAECAVLVGSDYGKGVLSDRVLAALMAAAARRDKPVVIDPKRPDFTAYRGARYIKPNRRELAQAAGLPCETDEEAQNAAARAIAQSGAAILLTRSEKGMSLFPPVGAAIHLSAEAREVFDVSGAGDTVTGVFSLGLAAGVSIEQAMRLANAAAGVVVGKVGTVVVTPQELSAALGGRVGLKSAEAPPAAAPLAEAVAQRRLWAAEGLVVGFTNGCFDLLHPGHISLLAQASAACDKLIVALNTDESVRRLKGPERPIQDFRSRAAVIGAIRGVDLVVGFAEDTPFELIRALEPDLLIKGADYSENEVVGAELVKARGGRVLLAVLEEGQSTSAIVRRAGAKRS